MPYDKVKKEDLWGVAADAPAPDEAVDCEEVGISPDGKVFNMDYAETEKKMLDILKQKALSGEIQKGINELIGDGGKVNLPKGLDGEFYKQFIDIGKDVDMEGLVGVAPPEEDTRQCEQLVWYPRNSTIDAGYADNTAVLDPIRYTNIQDLLARFFIQCHAQWGTVKNWRQNIVGVSSYCTPRDVPLGAPEANWGALHMPLFDYDGRNVKKIIRKDVKTLQKDFGLGNAWVYETRRGFHVYFFTDAVKWNEYHAMLEAVQCCKGFKRASTNRGYSVLRISAKYTDFDIRPLYVLEGECTKLRRLLQKAHVIQALLKLGEECGTHLASMYPQWAHFKQDSKEWRPNPKRPRAKRIKKAAKMEMKYANPDKDMMYTGTSATTSATYTVNNVWITNDNGTGNNF